MKPRFQLAFYPLSGKRLWIVLAIADPFRDGFDSMAHSYTTLDAEETAAFWKY